MKKKCWICDLPQRGEIDEAYRKGLRNIEFSLMTNKYKYCDRCGLLYRMESLMDKTKNFFGMEWAGPVGRTFAQAALPVIVAAGTNWVDADIWKVALLSGVAAVFAKIQGLLRD